MQFFSDHELDEQTKTKFDKDDLTNCSECGLSKGNTVQRMKKQGIGKVLMIGEYPSKMDDKNKKSFTDKSASFLRKELSKNDLSIHDNFTTINAVNCYPGTIGDSKKTLDPGDLHIGCCKPYVDSIIEETNPVHIWAMGKNAIKTLLMGDFKDIGINQFRGLCIPDQKLNAWISFMFDYPYVHSKKEDTNILKLYQRDLRAARNRIKLHKKRPPKFELNASDVECLYNYNDVVQVLDTLSFVKGRQTLDLETSGIKPFRNGHFIASISITVKDKCGYNKKTYSFPYEYKNYWSSYELEVIRTKMQMLLCDPEIEWVAQNMKYENLWCKFFFNAHDINWHWDTMMGSRIQDNRRKFSGLKFQTYLHYGVRPYDMHITPFLKSKKGTEFNRVDEVKLEDLLVYNGFDTKMTDLLCDKQTAYYDKNPKQKQAYDLFHEGTLSFSELEFEGFRADEEFYADKREELQAKIDRLKKELDNSVEAGKYLKRCKCEMNWTSGDDISKLFFEILGYNGTKTGGSNLKGRENFATDKFNLDKIDLPIVKTVLDYRRLSKVLGTYFAQFQRELNNGRIHPLYDLGLSYDDAANPISYRSASSRPNGQNIPVRDEEAKLACRGGLFTSEGNHLLEPDFGGIEVCIGTCYHLDPNMITYLTNTDSDMHRDSGGDIFLLPTSEIDSKVRFYTKNGWTFPQFYGDWYDACARMLWLNVVEGGLKTKSGMPVREHLKDENINSLDTFIEHCKSCQDIFWNERFRVYYQWRKAIQKEYQEKGYIESHFGFRFSGVLDSKQVCNVQIQGTAFHILLWTLNQVKRIAKEEGWKSKFLGQIHDSMIIDLNPHERVHVLKTIKYVATELTRKTFPWIIVPLTIDFEITPINGSWYSKKEIKYDDLVSGNFYQCNVSNLLGVNYG